MDEKLSEFLGTQGIRIKKSTKEAIKELANRRKRKHYEIVRIVLELLEQDLESGKLDETKF